MFELTLPHGLESLEIGVRLSRDVTRRDCLVTLQARNGEAEQEIRGWPVYPPVGMPAKYVSLGKRDEIQKFAVVKASKLGNHTLSIDVISNLGRPAAVSAAAVSAVAVLGKTNDNHEYAWKFEVANA